MNTTGKCIELFYWIYLRDASGRSGGDDVVDWTDTNIAITAIDEELDESTVSRSIGWDYSDFRRVFIRLPDGVHRIAVDGKRDSRRVASGISIDDVTIMHCNEFGKTSRDIVRRLQGAELGLEFFFEALTFLRIIPNVPALRIKTARNCHYKLRS